MHYKIVIATLAVFIGNEFVSAQQIPSTTTAAEMWNPWTWFWPYAIASAEAYRDYYDKAQKATNELYQQIYKTNAFPWVTGNWGLPQANPNGTQNNATGGSSQNNSTGGSGGQSNATGGSGGSGSSDQNNPTGSSGGSGQTNPSGGSGGSESGQSDPTGGSGGTGQKDSTTGSEGSTDAKVEGSV